MAARPECRGCRHFIRTPLELEALLPGLSSLSSGFASVRAEDGLCMVHERYVAAGSSCARYQHDQHIAQRNPACCDG